MLVVKDRSNVMLSDLGIIGSTAFYATADRTDERPTVRNVEATVTREMGGAFILAPMAAPYQGLVHRLPGGRRRGLWLPQHWLPGDSLVRDIEYINCTATNNGLTTRSHDWTVGFDLAEMTAVEGMRLVNCTANNNWESGFHFEDDIRAHDVVFVNCTANDNGRSKPSPLYGAGFVLNSNTVLRNCTADGNANGNLLVVGDPSTVMVQVVGAPSMYDGSMETAES